MVWYGKIQACSVCVTFNDVSLVASLYDADLIVRSVYDWTDNIDGIINFIDIPFLLVYCNS